LARATYADVLLVEIIPVGVTKRQKKQKLSRVKLAICSDYPRRRSALQFACEVRTGK